MIKVEGDNMGMAEDMGVISQGREVIRRENLQRTTQRMKMNKGKKRPCKWVDGCP
jgi:hypothetical protein